MICQNCCMQFTPTKFANGAQRFCSGKCRQSAYRRKRGGLSRIERANQVFRSRNRDRSISWNGQYSGPESNTGVDAPQKGKAVL